MRTNNRLRDQILHNIENFFDEAKERLHKPDFTTLGLPLIAQYKMDPEIHQYFYQYSWNEATIFVKDNGNFTIHLPKETYGIMNNKENVHFGWRLQVRIDGESCPTEIKEFWARRKEMDEARNALQTAAREALTETTVEKALIRFPELKRFLPNETQ